MVYPFPMLHSISSHSLDKGSWVLGVGLGSVSSIMEFLCFPTVSDLAPNNYGVSFQHIKQWEREITIRSQEKPTLQQGNPKLILWVDSFFFFFFFQGTSKPSQLVKMRQSDGRLFNLSITQLRHTTYTPIF